MAKKIKIEEFNRTEVENKDLKVGDKIYLAEKETSGYTVLDVGDPFILIENECHFAYLYRVTKPLWKDIITNN